MENSIWTFKHARQTGGKRKQLKQQNVNAMEQRNKETKMGFKNLLISYLTMPDINIFVI